MRRLSDTPWLSCLLVLTKENAFFVFVALVAILIANRWFKFGTVSNQLLLATALGPLLGAVTLVFLAGGFSTLVASYQLSVSKNYQLAYAVMTGDGPWYRYLVDLLLVNPLILLLAIGALFYLGREQKPELFLALFIAASYAVMCNIKYGMNLRYANMWDMPLCFLGFTELTRLVPATSRYRNVLIAAITVLLCAYELRAIPCSVRSLPGLRAGNGRPPAGSAHSQVALRNYLAPARNYTKGEVFVPLHASTVGNRDRDLSAFPGVSLHKVSR